jgi:hypothetical protein
VKPGSQLTAAIYLGLAFFAGSALGVSASYYYFKTPATEASARRMTSEELRQAYMSEMKSRLNLNADQEKRVIEILDQTRELFRQVQDKHRPEFIAIQDHQTEMIRSLLVPKQQAEYEALRRERQDRAARTMGTGPSAPRTK